MMGEKQAMSNFALANGMRQLRGQICTLHHQRPVADEAVRRGFMKFHEWPSGRWAYTQRGLNWLADGEWQEDAQ